MALTTTKKVIIAAALSGAAVVTYGSYEYFSLTPYTGREIAQPSEVRKHSVDRPVVNPRPRDETVAAAPMSDKQQIFKYTPTWKNMWKLADTARNRYRAHCEDFGVDIQNGYQRFVFDYVTRTGDKYIDPRLVPGNTEWIQKNVLDKIQKECPELAGDRISGTELAE